MRAIEFQLNTVKLMDVRYGESQFKKIDDFWVDFTPDDGVKIISFLANVVKDTPRNREIVDALVRHYQGVKAANDTYDKEMYQLRNQLEK